MMALSFFDFRLPTDIKIQMVKATKPLQYIKDTNIKKVLLSLRNIEEFIKREFNEFVSPET